MRRGFTVIELMIIVAIFGILLAVFIPTIASNIKTDSVWEIVDGGEVTRTSRVVQMSMGFWWKDENGVEHMSMTARARKIK